MYKLGEGYKDTHRIIPLNCFEFEKDIESNYFS
jgi:hypothetical protein